MYCSGGGYVLYYHHRYMVCSGLIDQLYAYFSVVYGPLDDCHSAQLVLDMLNILVATTALFHYKYYIVYTDME